MNIHSYLITFLLLYFSTFLSIDAVAAFEKEGQLPQQWIHGADCTSEPNVQVHAYNKDFYILRQSVCTNFEAPFIYLIFGQDKVLMQDTGASDVNLVAEVDKIINKWLKDNSKTSIELIVSHSHGHGDHTFADAQFSLRNKTRVIGKTANDVKTFFNFKQWPHQEVIYDLGGRKVQILPLPGHEPSHIVMYDPTTQLLLTGDSLYPGRLYFRQLTFHLFKDSYKRLTDWIADKPIKHVLGTHIEMTREPGKDYQFEAKRHDNERQLQLNKEHVFEVHRLLQSMTLPATKTVRDDFILYPLD